MAYPFIYKRSQKPFIGVITPVHNGSQQEYEIEADGNWFHVIIGDHAYGKYICIPNWNIGTELAGLSDHFWNSERLHLAGVSKTRSRILADALAESSRHQEKTERNAVEKACTRTKTGGCFCNL